MKEGSIVKTVGDFTEEERVWGLGYPKKGDVLTVSAIQSHPNRECREKGIVLLHFIELPGVPGLSDKLFTGKLNFVELRHYKTEEYWKMSERVFISGVEYWELNGIKV